MKAGIYKIINPKGAIYIGQSKDVDERIRRYKKLQCCKKQYLLYRSFLKYGVDNHSFEILEIGCYNKEELNIFEKDYIIKLNSFRKLNSLGMNLRTGGDSVELDDSIKEKMSIKRKELFKAGQRNSKIKLEDIKEVKRLIAYNKPLKDIADRFGVKITTISEIKSGRSWIDIPNYIVPENKQHLINRTNQFSRLRKLTEEQRLEVIEKYKTGNFSYKQLGKEYNLTKSGIQAIMRSFKKFNK